MTTAVLIWQTVIFVSILLAGRFRPWLVLFWIIWTLVQVFTLPLSIIQFATIAIAYFSSSLFSPSRKNTPRNVQYDPDEEERRIEAERQRIEQLRVLQKAQRNRREQATTRFLLWGAAVAGAIVWQVAYGINDLAMIVFFVSVIPAFAAFVKILD